MRVLILFAALASAVPAAAQEPVRFKHKGIQYEYVVDYRADGSRVITGSNLTYRQPFRLEVRGRDVTGRFGSDQVAFRAPAVRATQIASK